MQDAYKTIGRVAPQEVTVLNLGESGTGKEIVARALYHYSKRSKKPFLAVNCAALSESLLESDLFGLEKVAFTGVRQRRIGKSEQVNDGTIFLDEIGDIYPSTQAKALRLLQQQQFERVGGNMTLQTDVRIFAATNRDLAEMATAGTSRRASTINSSGLQSTCPLCAKEKLLDEGSNDIYRSVIQTVEAILFDRILKLPEATGKKPQSDLASLE